MKTNKQKLIILINAYSRDKSLDKCLESIRESNVNLDVPVVVLQQIGFPKVGSIIEKFSPHISSLRTVDGRGRSPIENINHNRNLGYAIAFQDYDADWVLAVEEDVQLSSDALAFVNFAIKKYGRNRFFRGINLGSREPFDNELSGTYSLLRYGMHGQASVIGRRTWTYIVRHQISKKFSSHGFDSLIEKHLKIGFMVTPNLSRSLDSGWDGTHMPNDMNDKYFLEMRESFVYDLQPPREYFRRDILHRWRTDIEVYRFHKTLKYLFLVNWFRFKHELKTYLKSTD